jgi:hypothetical protein
MTDRDVINEIGRILTDERYQPGVKLWLIAENVRHAKGQWAEEDAQAQERAE